MAKLYHNGEYIEIDSYNKLDDLPSINSVELKGDKSSIIDLKIPGKCNSSVFGEVFNDYRTRDINNKTGNSASGLYSHAEGEYTTASNEGAHAEGINTSASAKSAHAEGYETNASGHYSHAEGYGTNARALYSHAEGNGTTTSGSYSHAEGYETNAASEYSHAEGNETSATALAAHAEGAQTLASGNQSHAEGIGTTSSGKFSHAEGYMTTSGGNASHAEGANTSSSGVYSHAEGSDTLASGNSSHAGGMQTVASAQAQTVIGKYNANKTNTLFEVGNGNSRSSRSNAFEVYADGHVNINGDIYQNGAKINMGSGGQKVTWSRMSIILNTTASFAPGLGVSGSVGISTFTNGTFVGLHQPRVAYDNVVGDEYYVINNIIIDLFIRANKNAIPKDDGLNLYYHIKNIGDKTVNNITVAVDAFYIFSN